MENEETLLKLKAQVYDAREDASMLQRHIMGIAKALELDTEGLTLDTIHGAIEKLKNPEEE